MGPVTYNALFTLHGVIMIFLFVIPGLGAAFGNFMLPLMIGARDVAFPRLNLLSWWFYIGGAAIVITSLFTGGGPPDTGWTFYVPYSLRTTTNVPLAVFGAFVIGFSSILTGLNFITTIHRLRAPGMRFGNMPLFAWSLYATSWVQLLATPVLGITLLLVILERLFGVPIFDPAKGGDPLLYQHLFWIYSHPAVYVMILPAMGAVSEIIPTFARRTIFGYRFIAFSSMAIAGVGSLVWAHHMFTSGISDQAAMVFSLLTFLVAVPSAIKVFNWVSTLYKGSIQLSAAAALRARLRLPLQHRRAHRPDAGGARRQRPGPRHLLHRRALPLRHLRRDRLRLLRRAPLLVPEDVRADGGRAAREARVDSDLRRVQPASTSPCW